MYHTSQALIEYTCYRFVLRSTSELPPPLFRPEAAAVGAGAFERRPKVTSSAAAASSVALSSGK